MFLDTMLCLSALSELCINQVQFQLLVPYRIGCARFVLKNTFFFRMVGLKGVLTCINVRVCRQLIDGSVMDVLGFMTGSWCLHINVSSAAGSVTSYITCCKYVFLNLAMRFDCITTRF